MVEAVGNLLMRWEAWKARTMAQALKPKFKAIGQNSRLKWPVEIVGPEHMTIGSKFTLCENSLLLALEKYGKQEFEPEIVFGDSVRFGSCCRVVCANRVVLGNRVIVASRVYISDNLHGYRDITKSIGMNPLLVPGEIRIGDETWIGENACVFGDVTIGKHCVIGANSVVNKSIPEQWPPWGPP